MPRLDAIQLSLLENSHAFLREAVSKALVATSDTPHWQFAILNLVQSLELSLKAALKEIHPVLIFENIDNPKTTVSVMGALQRLESPSIGQLTFTDADKMKIRHAVKLRNQVTHSDFQLSREFAAAKFVEIFAFVSEFQRRHLDTKVSDIIPAEEFEQLVQIRELLQQLVKRATARIAEEQIDPKEIWACPNCGQDTFVIADGGETCYACSHVEPVVQCPHCLKLKFASEMESFFGDLDTDFDEGRFVIHNNYGYTDFEACPDCLPKITADIQSKREENEFRQLEEEYYRRAC